jgi:hypothetical protein
MIGTVKKLDGHQERNSANEPIKDGNTIAVT